MGFLSPNRQPRTGFFSTAASSPMPVGSGILNQRVGEASNPQSLSPPPAPTTTCPANLEVTRNGNNIEISGNIDFRRGDLGKDGYPAPLDGEVPADWQGMYLGWMNEKWTGPIGKYSVTTRLKAGDGGIVAYVGEPRVGGGAVLQGTNIMFLKPPDAEGKYAHQKKVAGHELGHIFRSPDAGGGIMERDAYGPPLEQHIDTLLRACGMVP